ncbi:MAG: peptide chain release factor 1 [Acidimicrobiia bacterium]|nr:peptide chain release factor 1 [Acidimicrobiia bacterium]MDH4306689.1 peptide chain release factor 1 [Acidimicrobiia bacterium]MDH5520134.1 peptide chain release factor 1 [Acidimicrobiia bacterium]
MDDRLEARLAEIQRSFSEIESQLADPEVIADPSRLADLGRRHSELRQIVDLYELWSAADTDRAEAEELAEADPSVAEEFRELAEERGGEAADLLERLKLALVPKDPNDAKDVIMEIRAGAGGDEAAIWAGDLTRMYQRYAERLGLTFEAMDSHPSEAGGYSKVTVGIRGRDAYSHLKFEGGVHRVQRVPKTESQGRVHTSTATVAVLPEAADVEVDLDVNDVRVDVFRSSGPGGQSVNTTDSAVRLTHEPTGITVSCQDEKSQLQNKEKAFRILRARLLQREQERAQSELAATRRSQVGTGERSEKIRTYNYKENRVTDHRIELTLYKLDQVLEGGLESFVEAMAAEEAAAALAGD